MRVELEHDQLRVRLARWEKVLGLMRDITVARGDIAEPEVVEHGVREAMGTGIKVGLRIPWLYYVARTLALDRAFIVRRGVPALSFAIGDGRTLRRVLVSTPRAGELARRLAGPG